MRAKELQPKKLVIFDIDDTLVHTQTKVHVIKDGQVVKSLNSHEFTHYKLGPGEEFDFGDFRDAREFFEKSKPIIPMIKQLKQDIATGNKVVMVTARADFNDRELFLDTFRKYGVDMSKVHVYRAGNMTGKIQTEEKKKIIIRKLLDDSSYDKAIMYDDAVPNLQSFLELKKEYPKTKFYAWHVSLEGKASEFQRTDEGWKDWAVGAAMGAAALGAHGKALDKHPTPKQPTAQHQQVKQKASIPQTPAAHKKKEKYEIWCLSNNPNEETIVHREAHNAGIKDTELAQFLAQVRHESADFGSMNEWGDPDYFKHKYDIEYAPKTAKMLGNIYPGDGVRYHGRGFIQITGRTHYHNAGLALGLPLEQKPELANKPEVAARIAVWYWKNHVRPRIRDFKNTDAVTELVNGKAKRGLRDRINSFKDYMEYIFFK
jgi:predicted chitinase